MLKYTRTRRRGRALVKPVTVNIQSTFGQHPWLSSFEHDWSHLLRSELASAIDFFRDSNNWDGHWISGAVFNIISLLPRKGWTLFCFCCGYILTIAGTSLVLWNRVVFNALANTTIMIAVFLFLITGCYLKYIFNSWDIKMGAFER